MGTVRTRKRSSLRALRYPLGLRTVGDDRRLLEREGVGAKSRLDVPLTLACALEIEERIARKAGARTARVGLGARLPLPEGPLVSFGFAGSLDPRLPPGALVTATKVVDVSGETLWEGSRKKRGGWGGRPPPPHTRAPARGPAPPPPLAPTGAPTPARSRSPFS